MEFLKYTLVPKSIACTTYSGANFSISGNISASNINLSGNLSVVGTMTESNLSIINLNETNISIGSANITNMTIANTLISKLMATGNSNTLGNLFTTGGNVGIGTTSPITKLNVQGDMSSIFAIDNSQFMISGQSNSNKRLGLMIDTTNNVGLIQAGFHGTGGYNLGLNPGGGNIGIGTTNPAYLLDVNGTARINNNLMINSASNNNLGINFPQTGYGLHWGNGNSRIYDDVDLRICTDDFMHFYTGSTTTSPGTERMTINVGNVGIGTSSPQYILDVNGSVRVNSSNNMYNKLLVLWDVIPADPLASATSFFGFGINNNTLRYQVNNDGSDYHLFYSGSSWTMKVQPHPSNQGQVSIPAVNGNIDTYWPSGWSGSLQTRDICNASSYASNFNQRSDIRKKQDIVDYTRGLKEVLELRPVSFRWKNHLEYGTQYGFIAQEVETVIPEIVKEDTAGFKYLSNHFYPMYVNAIKELKQELDDALKIIDQLSA